METPEQRTTDDGFVSLAMGMAFFLPVVFGGNAIATIVRYPQLGSAVLYLPYAALTTVLVVSPRRQWAWYIGAAAVAHATTSLESWSLSWVLFADVANIARALAAALLLRQEFGGVPRLERVGVLMRFLLIAVLVAPAVGATLGAANVAVHVASSTYWRSWLAWFMSSAVTGMVVLPGMLMAARHATSRRERPIAGRRVLEAVALGVLLVSTCAATYALHAERPGDLALLLYAPCPLLIWAALRFGHGGASAALTLVVASAIWGAADHGIGPFIFLSSDDGVLALQLFTMAVALPLLCVATIGAARRTAVQLHRALLASLQDQVAILDASGIVIEVNQSWDQFACAPHYCAIDKVRGGDDFHAVCTAVTRLPAEHPISPLGRAKAATVLGGVHRVLFGETRRFETEYEQCEGGPPQWFTLRIEKLERADGGVVVTRADVTARHRAQLDVEERRREVVHLGRISMLGQLSGALAHELRQPLASILANAESARLLLRREPVDREELRAVIQEIIDDDRHAAKIIEGLREMLKRGESRVGPAALEPLLRTVVVMARPELVARGVTVAVVVPPDLPAVLADAVQVQQVVLNLILNACEAMSESPPGRRVLTVAAATSDDRHVRISVQDTGNGIPDALLPRLFEPFVTTKPDGLGLGLSISRTIVAANGGRIWAENAPDGGAVVHCELSTAAGTEAATAASVPVPVPVITPAAAALPTSRLEPVMRT